MSKAEYQTIKQLRGQISALARENKMLNHKMSLLENNATLKQNLEQNAMFSNFLKWMEENGPRTNDDHGIDGKHKNAGLSVKEVPTSTASPRRSNVGNDVPTGYDQRGSDMNKTLDMGASSLKSKPDNGQLDRHDNNQADSDVRHEPNVDASRKNTDRRPTLNYHSHKESSQNGEVSLPSRNPFPKYRFPPNSEDWVHPPLYNDSYVVPHPGESTIVDSSCVRICCSTSQDDDDHDDAQLRSTPITSTPKRPSASCKNARRYDDLETRVWSLLEESRLAASPGLRAFAAHDVARDVDSRPVTSTPAKTPQKKVAFADEMNANTSLIYGDPVSSIPRSYNCDPLNLTTPQKTQGSVSRKLADQRDGSSTANDERSEVSRDERSFRRLTLNDNSDSRNCQRGGKSKRPTSSRKEDRHNSISKNEGARSKCSHENFSAKRELSFNDDKTSPRPSVNVNKLFGSRGNGYINHEHINSYGSQYDQASFGGESRSKRSKYDGVTTNSSGLSSGTSLLQSKSLSDHRSFNAESDISNNDSTIETLENELHGIYKQNLDDEVKITEIRRNAVKRFDSWRDAMESEMVKLERDGRERLADNINKLSKSLPPCLKCDCSSGFDGSSRSLAISEGPLSELEGKLGSRLADFEERNEKKLNDSVGAETYSKTETPSRKHGMERKRSVDTQTTSPKNLFMAGSDTIIFGEIAFQLERVILSRVFRGGSKQLTGYTLSNIEKMIRSHYDYHERPMLQRQLDEVKGELQICGWNHEFHPKLVAHLIKKFGTFPTNVRAKSAARKRGWFEPQALKEEVLWRIPQKYIHDMIIILDCLFYLSKKYNIPLFTW